MGESTVLHYFSARAPSYAHQAVRGLWGRLRSLESSAVKRFLPDLNQKSCIEFGAGAGFYTSILLDLGVHPLIAVELSPEMGRALQLSLMDRKTQVRLEVQDWLEFNAEKSVDCVLSFGALEFVHDPEAALRVMRESVTSNGRAYLMVPNSNWIGKIYRASHSRRDVPVRLFSSAELRRISKASGWKLLRTARAGLWNTLIELEVADS